MQSGDTLSKIAALYNTSVEKLVSYNNLSNTNNIAAGQPIKIPPADYEIPVGSTETTESTTEYHPTWEDINVYGYMVDVPED